MELVMDDKKALANEKLRNLLMFLEREQMRLDRPGARLVPSKNFGLHEARIWLPTPREIRAMCRAIQASKPAVIPRYDGEKNYLPRVYSLEIVDEAG